MKKSLSLTPFLRPPGSGVYTVSTGSNMASKLHKSIYKTASKKSVLARWKKDLSKIKSAKVVLLGCPSDNGAGVVRGANMGPLGLRQTLYANTTFKKWIRSGAVCDIGDIAVIPQLLEDEMLSSAQKKKSRKALSIQNGPVSPLSILEEVKKRIHSHNPKAKIMLLGGDHSLSWPMVKVAYQNIKKPFAILHFDAHTDLLKSRLGIDHCFGTWAYHANDLIGRRKRLVQVGIRASGKPKQHWEKTLSVKQFWATEIRKNPNGALKKIVEHLRSLKLNKVYISNDIDGTGMEYAAATGTPEPKGLHPNFVSRLIQSVGIRFEVIGGDLVEVAPVLHLNQRGEPHKTLRIGANYTLHMIAAMLRKK